MAALRDRDPAIKLFGRTIPLLDAAAAAEVITKLTNDVKNNDGVPCVSDKLLNVEAIPFCSKNSEENDLRAISRQGGKMETDSKSEEVKIESDVSGQDKVLKKPDKILPCPRCNSMETKFCYFNNYNVNQPRHYCRNCQRYWTAGGTMRNVPVGAGRRRNKHASHFRHAMVPCDNIVAAPGDVSEVIHHQGLPLVPPALPRPIKENETVTKFGSEVPVCKSMSSIINIEEQKNSEVIHHQALPLVPPTLPRPIKENETVTKFGSEVPVCKSMSSIINIGEQKNTDLVSLASGDNKEENSCASSAAVSGCSENRMPGNAVKEETNNVSGYSNGVTLPHPHTQSYPTGPALVFPWSPGWNSFAVMAATQCSTEPVHVLENAKPSPPSWPPPSMMTAPGICAPVVPFPLVPPFWRCIPRWPNGVWTSPWPGSNGTAVPSIPPNKFTCSENNSPTLGKHSREANLQDEEKTEKNLWVPKTLRVDDPTEAAKSSIWDALGIKPEDEKGVFKSFQSKDIKNGKTPESPQALKANPAAFSRSQSFQERT